MFDSLRKVMKKEIIVPSGGEVKFKREFYIKETRKKKNWAKPFWIALVSLIALVLTFGGWFAYELSLAKNKVVTENFGEKSPALEKKVALPETEDAKFDSSMVNVLLLGNGGIGHSGGGLTDVIQILSINTQEKKALLFSIPRDLFVDLPGFGKHRINAGYVLGESRGEGKGGDLIKKKVEEITGVPIHYYFKVDFTGFKKVVDMVDGVDVYVDKSIYDPVWGYSIKSGLHHFDGSQALGYVRSRKSTSDFDRSQRQQNLLFALRDKAMRNNVFMNPFHIGEMIEIVGNNLRTDLTPDEMLKIFNLAKELNRDNLTSYVLDNRKDGLLYSTISSGGAYIILPRGGNYKQIQAKVKELMP